MKKINTLLIIIIVTALWGCSKGSDRDNDTTTNSCKDYAMGQSAVYDAFKLVHQAANSSKGLAMFNLVDTTSLFGCDTLVVDTTSSPMTITIQFNGNCTGNNIERTGSITATFSGKYDGLGCIVNISFNNYSYKGYPLGTGSITYSYLGLTGSSPNYSYTANNIKLISDNKFIDWSGNQSIIITAGESTATVTDDNYTITGSANGSTFAGNNFSATINTDLTLAGNCEWVNAGVVTVSPENKTARVLDFGAGCDNKANMSVYGTNQEIIIP